MAQEDIEEVDDSERNKSDPGNTQEKEPNFGCLETKVTDESESNKAGPSRNKQEKEPKFDSASSNRVRAVEYIKYEVDKLRSHIAVLKCQIDNIRSQIHDRRSQSGSPSSIPRHVAIARTIAQLTHFSTPHPNCREPGRLSPPLEIIPQDEDMPEASTRRRNRRNRREPRRFSPTLEIVPEDEDMPEEKAPKSPVGDFLISDSRPGSSRSKGKSVVIDSSSQQYRGGRAGPRRRDDDISSELADKIAADQLMLYEDIDLLLSQVSNLADQALELKTQADGGPKSCKPESEAPTTRAEEDESKLCCAVRRLEITNKTDLASLDRRNSELIHKVAHLDLQVKILQYLVNDLRSKLRSSNNHGDRTRDDSPRYHSSEQRGRSSPTQERTTETESSSASRERHGKTIRMGCGCFGGPQKKSGKSNQ